MPIDTRLKKLEQQIPYRCPTCRSTLECSTCNDWKALARAHALDPKALVGRLTALIVEQLTGGTADEATH
jgi:hypothetical protein